jgi:hypothetical protein
MAGLAFEHQTTTNYTKSMRQFTLKLIIWPFLVIASLLPRAVQANENRGHHQSGIIGRVQVEQSGLAVHWQVSVSTDCDSTIVLEAADDEQVTVLQTEDDGRFVVNLKPGRYRLRPFVPVWFVSVSGDWLYAELAGPPVLVTVNKKDFTVVELPLGLPWPPSDNYQGVEVGDGTWLIPFSHQ